MFKKPMTQTQAVLGMVAAAAMWSMAGVVTRQLSQTQSFEITFWRSLFTVISLLVLLPLLQGKQVYKIIPWRNHLLWLSGACWAFMFTAFMIALSITSVANVLITLAVGPLMTAIVASVFIGHRLSLQTWLAIACAGLGIAYMFESQINLQGGKHVWGMAIAFLVPIAGATQWTLSQHAQAQGKSFDFLPSILIGAVVSCFVTLPMSWPMQATHTDLIWLAFLGCFQLAVPCALSVLCARVLAAPEVSLLALLEVIFGIALAWLGANETPETPVLWGGSIVLLSLFFNEWLSWRRR
jgi:drug/metabolite transporter (DMT)-like permease